MADDIVLEGKTTVDEKMVFEPQRLGYEAARTIAEKIARRISGRTRDRHVVVAGTQLLADFSNVVATRSLLEALAGEYDTLATAVNTSVPVVPHAPYFSRGRQTEYVQLAVPSFEAVSAGVKGALSLVSLFRQDVDYKGVPVSIDTLGFEIELAARIRMHKAREVIIPDFAVFHALDTKSSALRALIERVKAARIACIRAIVAKAPKVPKDFRIRLREAPSEVTGEREPVPEESAAPPAPNIDAMVEVLSQIDRRYNDLDTALEKMDVDGSGLTLLARLLRAEALSARAPLLVHARVLLAGGSNRISRSLFRTMFAGDGLSASGGAAVSWAILSVDGAIEDGGILTDCMSANSQKAPDIPHFIP